MMSTGRKSIAFINSTNTNTVSAIGATSRELAVVDALDLVVDEVERQLDERLRLRRHAGGRLARDEPEEAERQHAEQRPTSRRCRRGASRSRRPRRPAWPGSVRWCWMYSVGFVRTGCHGESRVSRGRSVRNRNEQRRQHERGEKRRRHEVPVQRQHQPKQHRRSPGSCSPRPATRRSRAPPGPRRPQSARTRSAYTTSAARLTAPPSTADNAPLPPGPRRPPRPRPLTVAIACHSSTVRIDRVWSGEVTRLRAPAPGTSPSTSWQKQTVRIIAFPTPFSQ